MIFTDIRLQNFRSYKDASFELGPNVTIIVGPNAVGKTNLLEALMLISKGGSYKDNASLLRQGESWARLDAHTSTNTVRTLKIKQADRVEKEFIIDDKPYKRLPLTEKQPTVLFEPNDLALLSKEPSLRRAFLDDLLEQTVEGYTSTINKYKRTLAQRNALLKSANPGKEELFAWNVRLADLASQIVAARQELTNKINEIITEIYQKISKTTDELTVKYETLARPENYASELLKKLDKNLEIDKIRGFTSHGPHRDDLVFTFKDRLVSLHASRGEIRTLLLALKIIELQLLEKQKGVKPLLLLDDVFSELDGARRKSLTSFLKNYQTIITTTDADIVTKNFSQSTQLIAL